MVIVLVMIGAEPVLFRPPSKLMVDAFRVEGSCVGAGGGGYDWLLIVTKLMLFVLIELVLMAAILAD